MPNLQPLAALMPKEGEGYPLYYIQRGHYQLPIVSSLRRAYNVKVVRLPGHRLLIRWRRFRFRGGIMRANVMPQLPTHIPQPPINGPLSSVRSWRTSPTILWSRTFATSAARRTVSLRLGSRSRRSRRLNHRQRRRPRKAKRPGRRKGLL